MSKFTIETSILKNVVNKASKGASKNNLITLTNLMNISVSDNCISVTTTDSNNFLTIKDSIICGDELTFTVAVDQFQKLVSKTSTDKITIELNDDSVTFNGNGTYHIPIQLDVDGTPVKFPQHRINNPSKSGSIPTSTIKDIILHNKPSLAVTMEAPYLTGYYCTERNVISADSFNICINDIETFGTDVLVSPIVFELLSMCTDESIKFSIVDNNVLFETSNLTLFAVFMNGKMNYPVEAISTYADKEYPSNCVIPKTAFLNIIDRLSLFIGDNEQNGIYMTFTKSGLTIESMNGKGVESIPYQGSENFSEYTCCAGVDSIKRQVAARSGELVNIYYGDEMSLAIKEDDIIQICALLDDPRMSTNN